MPTMALAYDGAIERLIEALAKLPGIGPKGAQRIAFYLLSAGDLRNLRQFVRNQSVLHLLRP